MDDERVSNEPFREAFQRSPHDAVEIVELLGWYNGRGEPDTQRLLKAIGIRSYYSHGKYRRQLTISYDLARDLCRVLHLLPFEVGI
jgi:hypothetical protein